MYPTLKDLSTKAKVSTPERSSTTTSSTEPTPTTKVKAILATMMNPLALTNTDVSDRLFEFYKENHTEGPKTKVEKGARISSPPVVQSSVYSTDKASPPAIPAPKNETIETSPGIIKTNGMNGPNGPITSTPTATASKNVNGDEMVGRDLPIPPSGNIKRTSAPFHPRIKYSNVNNKPIIPSTSTTSPVVPNVPLPAVVPAPVIQPPILPPSPAAAAIAAAIGYHNFQQMRAQELMKHQHPQSTPPIPPLPAKPQFYMQSLMRKEQHLSSDNGQSSSDENDEDDEEDEGGNKYPGIDDIQLIEGSKSGFSNHMSISMDGDYSADENHKYSMMAAQALRSFELSAGFGDYGSGSSAGEEPLYQCRHCGKRYRWKSTLRRHESVECGGKEPSHQCPYCPYKSKQRGNLGVHVRKHHANLPQLANENNDDDDEADQIMYEIITEEDDENNEADGQEEEINEAEEEEHEEAPKEQGSEVILLNYLNVPAYKHSNEGNDMHFVELEQIMDDISQESPRYSPQKKATTSKLQRDPIVSSSQKAESSVTMSTEKVSEVVNVQKVKEVADLLTITDILLKQRAFRRFKKEPK